MGNVIQGAFPAPKSEPTPKAPKADKAAEPVVDETE